MFLVLGWKANFLKRLETERVRTKKGNMLLQSLLKGLAFVSFVCFPSVQLLFLMFSDLAALCNYCLPSAGYLDLASCAHTFVSIERAVQTIFAFGVPGAGLSIVLVLFSSCSGLVLVLQTGSKLCDGIYFI